MEIMIKNQMIKPAEDIMADLRKAIENIKIVAEAFGSRGDVKPHERVMFCMAALDTIQAMATVALAGIKT